MELLSIGPKALDAILGGQRSYDDPKGLVAAIAPALTCWAVAGTGARWLTGARLRSTPASPAHRACFCELCAAPPPAPGPPAS